MRRNEENGTEKVSLIALVISMMIILGIIWAFCHFGVWYLSFLMYWEVKEWVEYAELYIRNKVR